MMLLGLSSFGNLRDDTMMTTQPKPLGIIWGLLSTASAVVSGYHGYRRNQSIGWGIVWFGLGGLFPVITPTIAVAQGFAKRK